MNRNFCARDPRPLSARGPAEILTALPVAHFMMDFIVARLAQRHEVAVRVRAATGYRHDVMYFLHRCDPAFLEALFTQGVSCHIPSTYSVPRSAVLAGSVGCSTVSVIFLPCLLAVLLAVRTVCQAGTAGVCTWSLWLPWHYFFFLRKSCPSFHLMMYQHCSKAPTFLYAIRLLLS